MDQLKDVLAYQGPIEDWVHEFLNKEGNNKAFSKGLKLQRRYWMGPLLLDLRKIPRCCGPEEDIQFHEPLENWERRIGSMVAAIKSGWKMPPLIVKYENGRYELNDGNHRHEALLRSGIHFYHVILWDSDNLLEKSHGLLSWIQSHYGPVEYQTCGGHVKEVIQFDHKDQSYVASAVPVTYDIKSNPWLQDQMLSRRIPVKQVVRSFVKDQRYEVSTYLPGSRPQFLQPAIVEVMKMIHESPLSKGGCGWLTHDGQGQFPDMKSFIASFFQEKQTGYWLDWFDLFNQGLDKDFFWFCYNKMMALLKYSEGRRSLVHGDFHLGNVLVEEDVVTGIIDWDQAMYFDKIFDAMVIGADCYEGEVYYEERLLCMQLIKGLDGMRFMVKNNHMEAYQHIRDDLKNLLKIK